MSALQATAVVVGALLVLPVIIYFCSKAATLGVLRAKKLFSQDNKPDTRTH